MFVVRAKRLERAVVRHLNKDTQHSVIEIQYLQSFLFVIWQMIGKSSTDGVTGYNASP